MELTFTGATQTANSSRQPSSTWQPETQHQTPTTSTAAMLSASKMALHDMSMGGFDEEGEHQHVLDRPDPTDDVNPQNWSARKKRLLFVALMSSSILCDGGMTWGATLVVPQSIEWKITPEHAATSLNYGILLQGIGGSLAVPLMDAFGRMPLWLWPQVITTGMVIGCCFATTFEAFTALRALQGLFGTLPQVIGLPIIHDIYAPREWPGMINIWGTTFLVGPFLGPALAGYIQSGTGDWRAAFGVLSALYGASTVLVLMFAREAYYNKSTGTQQPRTVKAWFAVGNTDLPKIKTMRRSSKVMIQLAFLRLPLLLTGLATLVNFTWPIGITTTISTILHSPPYLFDDVQDASMRFAGVIGALLGLAVGYAFNERIGLAAKKPETWTTEKRLHGAWVPIVSMIVGLLTYGLTLRDHRSWVGLAFGWVLVNIGLVASMVAITAYALEKYPEHSTATAAILNAWRTGGGFSVSYFQPDWLARNGAAAVFGTQAAVVAASAVLFVLPVMLMARKKSVRVDSAATSG